MNNLVCSFASYVVNSLWEVCLIGGAGWLVSRWLNRLGSQVEHAVWVSTLALAVLMPALPLWRWLSGFLYAYAGINEHLSVAFVAVDGVETGAKGVALLSPALIEVLLLVYGIALMYFAMRLGFSLYRTVKLYREACPISLPADRDGLWSRCKRALSIEDALVLSSRQIAGPVTIAFRDSILLLPVGFSEECSGDEFLTAVAHECAHMKRRDFQKNLFYEVMSLAIAFHPVTWMVKSQIAQTREMVCDGIATETLIDPHTYTQSLLRLAAMVSRVTPSHAIGIFDANILEKRIMMIQAKKQRFSLWFKYGLVVPSALVLLSAAIGAGKMAVAIAPQDSAKSSKEVYKIGKDVSAPVLIFSVEPEFPQSERGQKGKFEGTCLVSLTVDENGMPQDVHIVRSLRQDFDQEAIEAVSRYQFKPGMRAGVPVAVSLKVEVKFARF